MNKAYMVIWIDRHGKIVDGQTASEYPLTQLGRYPDGRRQVKLTETMGDDFQHALHRLIVRVQHDYPWAMDLPTFLKQRQSDVRPGAEVQATAPRGKG